MYECVDLYVGVWSLIPSNENLKTTHGRAPLLWDEGKRVMGGGICKCGTGTGRGTGRDEMGLGDTTVGM